MPASRRASPTRPTSGWGFDADGCEATDVARRAGLRALSQAALKPRRNSVETAKIAVAATAHAKADSVVGLSADVDCVLVVSIRRSTESLACPESSD